jgi:signal-transduction protein with cAMP-binding, CBS, and nucleotidyltransferase domain
MPTVADAMKRALKKVPNSMTVSEAARKMSAERIGSLFVEKKGEIVGIVTETDMVRKALATGESQGNLTVEKIMTYPIRTIEAGRSTQEASDMMGTLGIRHLGVTENGQLVGIISVRDLLVATQQRPSEPKIGQD